MEKGKVERMGGRKVEKAVWILNKINKIKRIPGSCWEGDIKMKFVGGLDQVGMGTGRMGGKWRDTV